MMAKLIIGLGNKCIDVFGSNSSNGAKVGIWEQNGGSNQMWNLTQDGYIESFMDPGKCLDIQGGVANNGTPIILWEKNGGDNQKWTLDSDGCFVSNLNPQRCIDVPGAENRNGVTLILWDKNSGINQRWRLDEFANVVIADSSIYSSTPTKEITLSDGGKIKVNLIRNPSSSALVINKIPTESLPTENKNGWTTEVKKVYLTADSTTFMSASANNTINIVPGAIYSFEDFIGGANNEILGNRNPIRIYTDNAVSPGAVGGILVNNPGGYEILQGNGGANLNVIKNSIVESPSGVILLSQSFTSNSEAELMIKITAGGSYGGFTGSAGYTHNQNETHFYLTVDVVKPMYTIKAEKPERGFFVNANIIPNKVYVKEVNYGTRILANVEIVLENREDIINFKASYEGVFKANLGLDFISKNKTKNEKANAYLIGAPITATLLNKDILEADITALLSTCGFQHAVPISYTLGDMDGNTIATHSTTDEVIERNSVPDNLVYHLDEASIEITTGDDNKEWQSQVAIELYSGNAPDGHILMYQPKNSNLEFPINSSITVGLNLHPDTNTDDLLLNNIKNAGGLRVRIFYYANWPTDAWKINGVGLKLKFIDQNGIVYPTSAGTIPLNGKIALECVNAVQTLDGFNRRAMECFFNWNFTATTSTVSKN